MQSMVHNHCLGGYFQAAILTPDISDCYEKFGDEWIPRLGTRSCYKQTTKSANFTESRNYCTLERSELITIHDEDEARFFNGN